MTPVLEVQNLVVEYGKGARATRAVDDISFRVETGECVGFIGANGAGKSTTIKTLMGFVFPRSGEARLFGNPAGDAASRARVGYLPEVALYYPFMKARELLELYGGLGGLSKDELGERIPPLLKKVGLEGSGEKLLKNFSKGMQQRLGIAQSLITEPEALIFDELSSGLDPLGRHDLREVLLNLKAAGRTIFFSSHELSEVEALCDRVIIIHEGRIVTEAPTEELMKPLSQYEVVLPAAEMERLPAEISKDIIERDGNRACIVFDDLDRYTKALNDLNEADVKVLQTSSRQKSLEDYFIELVRSEGARDSGLGSRENTKD
jgi:ABC-2 type transport system ATP-binding protein